MGTARVTVRTTRQSAPPHDASSSTHAATGDLYLLQRSDRTGPPMFCQFDSRYSSSPMVVQNNPSEHRTIATSGCGLCALASYVAAAGCKAPHWDARQRTFSAGTELVNPRTFNEYLTRYSESRGYTASASGHHPIYAPDPEGALRDTAHATWDAIDRLYELSHGLTANSFHGFRCTPHQVRSVEGAPGREIPELTAHLASGKPAILCVRFQHGGHEGLHQVLAVGVAVIGTQRWYVVLDSGWSGCYSPYDALDNDRQQHASFSGRQNPVRASELLRCSLSRENRPQGGDREFTGIFCWKALEGLEDQTHLTLTPALPS